MSRPNNSPNEILWQDGELFGKWVADDTCHGLPGQTYPKPFLERLFDKLDRDADRREAAQRVLEFPPDSLACTERNQLQIDAETRARRSKKRFPRINWSDEVPLAHFPEFPPREQVYRPAPHTPRQHKPGSIKWES